MPARSISRFKEKRDDDDIAYRHQHRRLARLLEHGFGLDDQGEGNLGLEIRRVDVPGAQWTGVRAISAVPLGKRFRYSSEIEIVAADHPDGRGAAWPWGLSALSWRSEDGWEVAGALEASATPLHRYEADALVHLSCALDRPSRNASLNPGASGPSATSR